MIRQERTDKQKAGCWMLVKQLAKMADRHMAVLLECRKQDYNSRENNSQTVIKKSHSKDK